MSSLCTRPGPSSLDLLPGEAAQPPLRLLERQSTPARAQARSPAVSSPGWWQRVCQEMRRRTLR